MSFESVPIPIVRLFRFIPSGLNDYAGRGTSAGQRLSAKGPGS